MHFIDIEHSLCKARISLKGGQLLSWQPRHTASDILWCTPDRFFKENKPIRGGIPICWPWFGRSKLPAHGFVRNMLWTLNSRKETSEGVEVILKLSDNQDTRELWPHAFLLTLRIFLGLRCHVELSIDCEAASHGALHTYFHVNDINKVSIEGTGKEFMDSITGAADKQSNSGLSAPIQIDRIYTKPLPTTQLSDLHSGRRVNLLHTHIRDLVVWNPGLEAATQLGDVEMDAFKSFVCIETAAVNKPLGSSIGVTIELTQP